MGRDCTGIRAKLSTVNTTNQERLFSVSMNIVGSSKRSD